jgi:hypothetical protein
MMSRDDKMEIVTELMTELQDKINDALEIVNKL